MEVTMVDIILGAGIILNAICILLLEHKKANKMYK